MINLLLYSIVPLTLILTLLLIIRQPLRKKTDANTSYALWLLLPLALILYSLELPWHYVSELTNVSIQTYLVRPSESLQQQLTANNLIILTIQSFWLMGVMTLVSYWFFCHFTFKKSLKATALTDANLSAQLGQYTPKKLAVKQSEHLYSPILIGLITPTIVIPENFTELYSVAQQELIIAHEICHYSHHHMWANQLALLLLALFWFHPLAWRAYAAFRQDQEHSCDQTVLARRQPKSRIEYCKALVLAAETSPPKAFTLMSFKHHGEQNFMFNRIEQIKDMSNKSLVFTTTKLSLVALIATSLLVGISYAGNHLQANSKLEQSQINAHPTYRVDPKYPIQAAQEKIEGSVVLKFDIKGDGSVNNVEVVIGKPAYIFDKTAVTAVKQWRYQGIGKVQKNVMVQLDYLMDNSTTEAKSLIERIKVTN